VINKNFGEALKIKEVVDEIYGEFLQFDLRNSELRKKSDQIKWSLKKLEEISYDLSRR
jgi:predicted translin family RNA/ssDNA-binding protein